MAKKFDELGRIGQNRSAGQFMEEFLPELRGRRGIQTYKEMAENDDIIGSILFAIEMLIKSCEWSAVSAGNSDADKRAAEFIEQCMNDMSDTWIDTISEILSFLTYGWSLHEIVYKRRLGRSRDKDNSSKYNDGLIGWRKMPIRAQETLYEWVYDDKSDNLIAFRQMPPPDYGIITIPMEKCLLFRTKKRKGNPEGRSILRNSYRSWYFKKRIQEIEGMGAERDLAGFPVLTAPENMDIWNPDDPAAIINRNNAVNLVKSIKRDSQEGAVLPAGWKLELLTSGGKRQFDTSEMIERYDSRMAMTVLADFVLMGHQSVGTYSLGADKTQLFSVAIGTYLDIIAEQFNKKAIPDLIDINGSEFDGITDYPTIIHSEIENRNIAELADFVSRLTACGALTPTPELEKYLRNSAKLPAEDDVGFMEK